MPKLTPRIEVAFRGFHERNPEVYQTLVALARQAHNKGIGKIGIAMLWERLRWELIVETPGGKQRFTSLNNSYRSRYARLIMEQEKDLADIFETRELKQD